MRCRFPGEGGGFRVALPRVFPDDGSGVSREASDVPCGSARFLAWLADSSGGVSALGCGEAVWSIVDTGRGTAVEPVAEPVDVWLWEARCLSRLSGGAGSRCRFKTAVPGMSVSSPGWLSAHLLGFMTLLRAPPEPMTSG